MRSGRKAGFTLIELLVVIAIIAILAAILFPVFARARAKARQAACQSNLKQLALGFQMYAQDYDQTLPLWGYGPAGATGDNGPAQGFYSWDTVLMPYLKNQQILICPDNPYGKGFRSYAMTRYTGDAYGNNATPLALDYVNQPASTVLLFDKGEKAPGLSGDAAGEAFYQSHGATGNSLLTDMFHNGGKNFAYLDGHVKFASGGGGPFASNPGATCPPAGFPTGGGRPYESHGPGHCETSADWPQ